MFKFIILLFILIQIPTFGFFETSKNQQTTITNIKLMSSRSTDYYKNIKELRTIDNFHGGFIFVQFITKEGYKMIYRGDFLIEIRGKYNEPFN